MQNTNNKATKSNEEELPTLKATSVWTVKTDVKNRKESVVKRFTAKQLTVREIWDNHGIISNMESKEYENAKVEIIKKEWDERFNDSEPYTHYYINCIVVNGTEVEGDVYNIWQSGERILAEVCVGWG